MGEGIDIEQSRKQRKNRRSGPEVRGSRFIQQVDRQRETMRAKAKSMMAPLKDTHVEIAGKRKAISVKIDQKSINHIANDIAIGRVPLELVSQNTFKEKLKGARQISVSQKDKEGKHSDKPKGVKDYRYFEIYHNGKPYYLNVESRDSGGGPNIKRTYRLHTISGSLKDNDTDGRHKDV